VFPLGTSAAAAALPGRPLLAGDGAIAPAAKEEDSAVRVGDDSSSGQSDMEVDMFLDGNTDSPFQGMHTVTVQ